MSEFHENWEKLSLSKEEEKFLLPTNWDLIYSLLVELKSRDHVEALVMKDIPKAENAASPKEWKAQLRQILLALIEFDFRRLLEKYNQQLFQHPSTKLNYKAIHPEEIRHKIKSVHTISGMKNLSSFLNRRLDILPLFSNSKDENLKIYQSWKINELQGETSFKYDEKLIKEWESKAPDLFVLHSFKEPPLPIFS